MNLQQLRNLITNLKVNEEETTGHPLSAAEIVAIEKFYTFVENSLKERDADEEYLENE